MSDRAITPHDDEWPERLNELGRACPQQLYVRGRRLLAGKRTVAIVGARYPTAAGLDAAEKFATGLTEAGFTIVSGLALGIDAAAHRACLEAGGYTIAVLGCGMDVDYPARNSALKKRIVEVGTVVTEYRPGTSPDPFRFPQRNRIVAGLARGVLYVEGGHRSGGLITAHAALDFNRYVFAVPGSIRNPLAAGPNELIRTSQAALVTEVKHICDDLEPGLVWDGPPSLGLHHAPVALEDQEARVLTFLDDKPVSAESICAKLGMKPGEAALALSRLEIRGFVSRRNSGYEIAGAGSRVRAALMNGEDESEGRPTALEK
jgi:DNA processing protein